MMEGEIKINKYNIKYPEDFYKFGASNKGRKITDKEIQEWIDECLDPTSGKTNISCGDTMVFVNEYNEDIVDVFVCKNYWNETINKHDEKYNAQTLKENDLVEIVNGRFIGYQGKIQNIDIMDKQRPIALRINGYDFEGWTYVNYDDVTKVYK